MHPSGAAVAWLVVSWSHFKVLLVAHSQHAALAFLSPINRSPRTNKVSRFRDMKPRRLIHPAALGLAVLVLASRQVQVMRGSNSLSSKIC